MLRATVGLIVWIMLALLAGVVGGVATGRAAPEYYRELTLPPFAPPAWVFGPVWTVLYILMGVAAYLVWRKGMHVGEVQWALILFVAQLAFNAAWTPVFFGAQAIGGAMLVMLALIVLLGLTIRQFLRVRRLAGYLLVPYGLWVLYAAALNFAIWLMN
jgi:translocator protein